MAEHPVYHQQSLEGKKKKKKSQYFPLSTENKMLRKLENLITKKIF